MTKACQSLRDMADEVQEQMQQLNINGTLDEEEKTGNPKVLFIVTPSSEHSVNDSQKVGAGDQTEGRQHEQSSQTIPVRGRNEDTEQTGDHSADTGGEHEGGDAGGQRSDNDQEDKDNDDSRDPTNDPSTNEYENDTGGEQEQGDSHDPISVPITNEDENGEAPSTSTPSTPLIKMGLVNAHSINKKQSKISNFSDKSKLKVLQLTETWVTPENGAQRLGEIKPEFRFYHQPRVDNEGRPKRGGGVAVLYSEELKGTRIRYRYESSESSESSESFESFEYVATDLLHKEWPRPMRTITIYRRPGYDVKPFLDEFEALVKTFTDESILITGDFNIKVNDEKYKPATRFKEFLVNNNLRQHVEEPTHNTGNTLDLVITRNVDISDLHVENTETETETQISDHYAIIFDACPTSENTQQRRDTPPRQ